MIRIHGISRKRRRTRRAGRTSCGTSRNMGFRAHNCLWDKCLGLVDALGNVFPEAKYQRCVVHFYRNMFSVTPHGKVKEVAAMLNAIYAQEDKQSARDKAKSVVGKLRSMKLKEAADKLEKGMEETLTYMDFPREHWTRIRTNNGIERIMMEIRRRTRVVVAFPDGNSTLMLVCARLRHVSASSWGEKRYLCMDKLSKFDLAEILA